MNHAKLQQYLDEHGCEALTHEEVSGLREWIDQQVNTPDRKFTDEDYDLFIISTTKACPSCGYRSTHYHGHQCHHISPARPPQRGGCPNCHVNYCYKCLSTEVENRRDRGSESRCRCGYWSNFCHTIKSSSDIKSYIATNGGGIPYDTRCGCVICSDCKYGKSCDYCPGDCCVCRGHVNPSPNECIDAKNGAKKWIAEGPSLSKEAAANRTLWDCCRQGDVEALAQLLQSTALATEELNRQDRDGRTALYLACDANHSDCVRLLLSHDGIDPNIANSRGYTPLHAACENGNTDTVSLLLGHDGIDVNVANNNGNTPLRTACHNGHTDIVRLLLAHAGIDVSIPNSYGWSPLYVACDNGHTDIVRLLLSHDGISVNIANSGGYTPLHVACYSGHTDTVRLLLSHDGIDVNIPNSDGQTPLSYACDRGHTDIVRLLLSHDGINVNIPNSDGWSPLYIACEEGHTDIVRLLLSHDGIVFDTRPGSIYSMAGSDKDMVRLLLSHAGIDDSKANNSMHDLC